MHYKSALISIAILVLGYISPILCQTSGDCLNDDLIVSNIFENATYNKHSVPAPGPVDVTLEIFLQEVSSISDVSNDIEMDIYVIEYWNDPRLAYKHANPCHTNVSVNHQVFNLIWSPNTGFINSKSVQIHDSPFRNMYMIIYQNGTVRLNYRVKVKAPCQMNLRWFPMDRLVCTLQYESFSYNVQRVRLAWSTISQRPVTILSKISLAGFTLLDISNDLKHNLYPGGVWDELRLTFKFERHSVWYVVYIYVPTFFSLLISWLGICLGVRAISARAILCACSFVCLIVTFGKMMSVIPQYSSLKAIDVWILSLLLFSFLTVLELAVIGCWAASRAETRPRRALVYSDPADEESSLAVDSKTKKAYRSKVTRKDSSVYFNCAFFTVERVDKFAGYFLPTVFALFNIIYWSYYAQHHE